MDRLACVDLPAFPLQLLLRRFLDWRGEPVAVVDRDHPQGKILWVDERARRQKVLPGQRYSAALSQCGELRAGEVSNEAIDEAAEMVLRLLWKFSPGVEPVAGGQVAGGQVAGGQVEGGLMGFRGEHSSGTFWVDARGLVSLYPSLEHWSDLVRSSLAARQLIATIAVGFSKFGTCVVARSSRESVVFESLAEECEFARRVPLERLPLAPRVRDRLGLLGVRTIGDFVELPPESMAKRFAREVVDLHAAARAALGEVALGREGSASAELPLIAIVPESPISVHVQLGYAETSFSRLFWAFERELPKLLERLAERNSALTELEWVLWLESGEPFRDRLKTAAPTLEVGQVSELIRLRFDSLPKRLASRDRQASSREPDARKGEQKGRRRRAGPVAVIEFSLEVRGQEAQQEQLEFFLKRPARDLAAANRALARLRAEFGEGAVVTARLEEGHLPEARFVWEPLIVLEGGGAFEGGEPLPWTAKGVLVRRVYERPHPLPPRPRQEPDGWMLRGLTEGPVAKVFGPFVLSGGWWRKRIHREYHFAETQKGDLLWVYYDRVRRRWFLQGRVE